jgi:hypothetical protein
MWNLVLSMTDFRGEIESLKQRLLEEKATLNNCEVNETEDRGEEMANIMLAYRHLEDAKMRLGKVIQAYEGSSPYDTEPKK